MQKEHKEGWEDAVRLPTPAVPTLSDELKRFNTGLAATFGSSRAALDAFLKCKQFVATNVNGPGFKFPSMELVAWVAESIAKVTNEEFSDAELDSLAHACACLVRAEDANVHGEHSDAWFYLGLAHECFGRARGYGEARDEISKKQHRGTLGGHGKAESQGLYLLKAALILFLSEDRPDGGWVSHESTAQILHTKLQEFCDVAKIPVVKCEETALEWLARDPNVKAAYAQTKFSSGRKPPKRRQPIPQ